MASNIDLFVHPNQVQAVEDLIANLTAQCKIVRGFEKTKTILQASPVLSSGNLKRCNQFVHHVEAVAEDSNFLQEISKLTLDELVFISVSFATRSLDVIGESLRAIQIRAYMKSQNLEAVYTQRADIHGRLAYLLRTSSCDRFRNIYTRLQADEAKEEMAKEAPGKASTFGNLEKRFIN